mmetsp:Transcript_15860/g.40434  ORF Transcript_15860/g.40434 Transcript_15860/m.40434 type:complete len:229 (+) Transcript_15860:246-932(+)
MQRLARISRVQSDARRSCCLCERAQLSGRAHAVACAFALVHRQQADSAPLDKIDAELRGTLLGVRIKVFWRVTHGDSMHARAQPGEAHAQRNCSRRAARATRDNDMLDWRPSGQLVEQLLHRRQVAPSSQRGGPAHGNHVWPLPRGDQSRLLHAQQRVRAMTRIVALGDGLDGRACEPAEEQVAAKPDVTDVAGVLVADAEDQARVEPDEPRGNGRGAAMVRLNAPYR